MRQLALGLSLLWSVMSAGGAVAADMKRAPAAFTAKLEAEGSRTFYGTALLWGVRGRDVLYVTNAHVINAEGGQWQALQQALRIRLPYCDYRAFLPRALGSHPGYDVAVLAVSVDESCLAKAAEIAREVPERIDLEDAAARRHDRVALVGYPRYGEKLEPESRATFWHDAAVAKIRREAAVGGEVEGQRRVQSERVCPPVFLRQCYRVGIVSWGFSGGALIVEREGEFKLAGIISHYSPLSEDTYVIPMATALRVARRLVEGFDRRQGSAAPFIDRGDETGTFYYHSQTMVRVLKGPLAGAMLEAAAWGERVSFSRGVIGGGGEFSAGGHDSAGGGGSGDDGQVWTEVDGGVASTLSFAALASQLGDSWPWMKDAGNPMRLLFHRHTAFRGIGALLDLQPGVTITQGRAQRTYHSYGGTRVASLQSMIDLYARGVQGELNSDVVGKILPNEFAMAALNAESKASFGIYSQAMVRPIRTDEGLPEGTQVVGPAAASAVMSVSEATLTRKDGWVTISLKTADDPARTRYIQFPNRIISQSGDFYRYLGRVVTSVQGEGEPRVMHDGAGIAFIQRMRPDMPYELKLITASKAAGVDEIRLEGVYLPLWERR